jgi:hypothetical protein
MTELLSIRHAAKALHLTQAEILYNVGLGRIPALKLQKPDGTEYYRFSLPLIEEAMKAGTFAEKSVLKGYKAGRLSCYQ